MEPVYLTAGIPKSSWYRWLGKLILAEKDSRGRYQLSPREAGLARIAGALHKLGIREPQLAPLLGRLRELAPRDRAELVENLVVVQTGRRTYSFFDSADEVPQIEPIAIYFLKELLG